MNLIGDAAHHALAKKIEDKLIEQSFIESFEHLGEMVMKRLALDHVMAESGYGSLRQVLIRNCLRFTGGYIGVYLIIVSIGIELLYESLQDSKLVEWAKTTPFALVRTEVIEEEILLAKFANIMAHATAHIDKVTDENKSNHYYVEIFLPQFDAQSDRLKVQIYSKEVSIEFYSEGFMKHSRVVHGKEYLLKQGKQESFYDDGLQLKRVRIYFETGNYYNEADCAHEIRAQFKIILKNGLYLPLRKHQGNYLHDGTGTSQFHKNYYHTPVFNIKGAINE